MKRAYVIEMDKADTLRLVAYGMLLAFLGFSVFDVVRGSDSVTNGNPFIMVLVYFATLFIHEAIHGFFFWVYGAKPTFGVGVQAKILPYAYATAHNSKLKFWQMVIVGLSPFILLSIVTLGAAALWPAYASYLLVAFIGNFAGAVGDLWLMSKLWKFRKCKPMRIVDLRTGVAIDTDDKRATKIATRLSAQKGSGKTAFINTWLKLFLGLLVFAFLAAMLFTAINYSGDVLIGSKHLYFIQYTANEHTKALTVNVLALAIVAFIGASLQRLSAKR